MREAVDAPHAKHSIGVTAKGDQQIHSHCHHQTQADQLFGADPVAKNTADDLPAAIGDEAARQSHGQQIPGDAGGDLHLRNDGSVVDPGDVAGHVGEHEEYSQPGDLPLVGKNVHKDTFPP